MKSEDRDIEQLGGRSDSGDILNPYQAPHGSVPSKRRTHPILWLALFGIFAKVTALCVFFIPGYGVVVAYDVFAATYLVLAYWNPSFLRPLRLKTPTIFETLFVLGIGCLLHLLLQPAVQM